MKIMRFILLSTMLCLCGYCFCLPTYSVKAESSGGLNYTITSENQVRIDGFTDTQLNSITIPASVEIAGKNYNVTTIKVNAFRDATNLTQVDFSQATNLTTIARNAFDNSGLTGNIKFNNSLQFIRDDVFANTNITSITLNSLPEIGTNSFGTAITKLLVDEVNYENALTQYTEYADIISYTYSLKIKLTNTVTTTAYKLEYGKKYPSTLFSLLKTDYENSNTNHTLIGWKVEDDLVTLDETSMANAIANNKTLVAVWQENSIFYNITLNTYGGLLPDEKTTNFTYDYSLGYELFNLNAPVNTNWVFDGWFDNANCTGTAINQIPANNDIHNYTLYAKWKTFNYSISYNDSLYALHERNGNSGYNYIIANNYTNINSVISTIDALRYFDNNYIDCDIIFNESVSNVDDIVLNHGLYNFNQGNIIGNIIVNDGQLNINNLKLIGNITTNNKIFISNNNLSEITITYTNNIESKNTIIIDSNFTGIISITNTGYHLENINNKLVAVLNEYNVVLPTNIAYTINGNAKITHNENYTFVVTIDNKFSSNITAQLNNSDLELQTVSKINNVITYQINHVTEDIEITISGVTLNAPSIEINQFTIDDQPVNDIGYGASVKLTATENSNIYVSTTYTWYEKINNIYVKIDNETNASYTTSNQLSLGEHIFRVGIKGKFDTYESESFKDYTVCINKSKVYISLPQGLVYTYDNLTKPLTFTPIYRNYCGDMASSIFVDYLLFQGENYSKINTLPKQAGNYHIILTCEDYIEFTSDSVTDTYIHITPCKIKAWYVGNNLEYTYNGLSQFPNLDYIDTNWQNANFNRNDLYERFYKLNSDSYELIYNLPESESKRDYASYFTNCGSYKVEIYSANPNFVTINNGSNTVTTCLYTISRKNYVANVSLSAIYESSTINPTGVYNVVLTENQSVDITIEFTRELGDDANTYAITAINKVYDENGVESNNYNVTLSNKSANTYIILPKGINVIWSEVVEFVFDGNLHSPTAIVEAEYSDIVGLLINGKQSLANSSSQPTYTATASSTNNNYVILNSTKLFVIKPTRLTNYDNNTLKEKAFVISNNGFNPNEQVVVTKENSTNLSTLSTNLVNELPKNYIVSDAYTVNVMANGEKVNYNNNVTINFLKPTYFSSNMKIYEIQANGIAKEITFSQEGDYLVLANVSLDSHYVFVHEEEQSKLMWLLIFTAFALICIIFVGIWYIKHRNIKAKQ